MIPLSEQNGQSKSWQKEYASAITSLEELVKILELPENLIDQAHSANEQFSLKVPLSYLARIEKGNPDDPLLRQILPCPDENIKNPGFVIDPVGDLKASPLPGLIHKYANRVLLVATPACAIHCRYCFRRHYPYSEASATGFDLARAIEYIKKHQNVNEVILSGGDPLSLSDKLIGKIIQEIEQIEHIKTLRIHSRLAVTLPSRLTASLKSLLSQSRLNSVLVVHCNHPNELSEHFAENIRGYAQAAITCLNQSVLLAGINDETDTLVKLSEKLFYSGILPYYIHMLDPVEGATHFQVSREKSLKLMKDIQKILPGYLLPRLVEEISGMPSKQTIF